jgi:hypothetical protein
MPNLWEYVLTLSEYLVASGDSPMYCKYWLEKTEGLKPHEMTSQKISTLLLSITNENRQLFYEKWAAKNLESEMLALDITSISSYSEQIDDVMWEYDRDKELPQENLLHVSN